MYRHLTFFYSSHCRLFFALFVQHSKSDWALLANLSMKEDNLQIYCNTTQTTPSGCVAVTLAKKGCDNIDLSKELACPPYNQQTRQHKRIHFPARFTESITIRPSDKLDTQYHYFFFVLMRTIYVLVCNATILYNY